MGPPVLGLGLDPQETVLPVLCLPPAPLGSPRRVCGSFPLGQVAPPSVNSPGLSGLCWGWGGKGSAQGPGPGRGPLTPDPLHHQFSPPGWTKHVSHNPGACRSPPSVCAVLRLRPSAHPAQPGPRPRGGSGADGTSESTAHVPNPSRDGEGPNPFLFSWPWPCCPAPRAACSRHLLPRGAWL